MSNRLRKMLVPIAVLGCGLALSATARTWTNSASGPWTNAGSWDPNGVPTAADDVVIPQATVTIATTATVNSLTVSGSGFLKVAAQGGADPAVQTPLDADATNAVALYVSGDLTLAGSGKLALGGLNQNANATLSVGGALILTNAAKLAVYAGPTNASAAIETGGSWVSVAGSTTVGAGCWIYPVCDQRSGAAVFFALQDLSVASTAGFNADTRGFGRVAGFPLAPGAGTSYYIGASHGGRGGCGINYTPPPTYGSLETPFLPGSPSGDYNGWRAGGGSIRIDAANVTLHGTLQANGLNNGIYGASSGGGIWLSCLSLQGEGRISASAGYCSGSYGSDGGGGRIALDVGQEVADPSQCSIAVAVRQGIDHTGRIAEAGTLWLSKLSLLRALLPNLEGAQIFCPELDDAPVALAPVSPTAKTHIFFNTPCTMTITGNVSIAADALLGFGGIGAAGRRFRAVDGGTAPYAITVDGSVNVAGALVLAGTGTAARATLAVSNDLTIADLGDLYAYAAPTNGTITFQTGGSRVTVGDTLTVETGGCAWPICDEFTGAPVVFAVSNLVVEEGGWFKADEAGWGYAGGVTIAPGKGYSYNRGGGYGGYGGSHNATYGNTYGEQYAPFRPGSPNGTYQPYRRGGGAVCIHCSGTAVLEGSVTANGNDPDKSPSWAGGPSGGGIWITARSFEYGANLILEAKGGRSNYSSGGGGGRICLAAGCGDYIDDFYAGTLPGDVSVETLALDGVDVSGNVTAGEDGTAVLLSGPSAEKALTVRGAPVNAGTPSPDYGIAQYAHGSVVSCYAPATGLDPGLDNRSRLFCTGYVASNAVGQVAAGAGTNVDLTLDENLTLTWLWGSREHLFEAAAAGNGSLMVDGSPAGAFSEWVPAGGTPTSVTAVADAGYEFVAWAGDVPYGLVDDAAVAPTMDVPRRMTAHFASDTGTTRTWSGGTGAWFDPGQWSPQGTPALDDDVVISAGVCTLSNYAEVASVSLSGSAILRVGGVEGDTPAANNQEPIASLSLGEGGLKVSADLSLSDSSQLGVGGLNASYPGHLTVGGNLTLAGAAKLAVYAGPTNKTFSFVTGGGWVSVSGVATVGSNCWVYPTCHRVYGSPVRFDIGTLYVADGGGFDADERGFGWTVTGVYPEEITTTLAPGRGFSYSYGAGYGGYGGNHNGTYGNVYGSEYAPFRPGSCNGYYYNGGTFPNCYSVGGGALNLHCRRATINGTLRANGDTHLAYGGSSGGGIWLTTSTRSLVLGATAVLQANGGDSNYNSEGGGGRIAIGIGLSDGQLAQAYDGEVQPGGTWEWMQAEIDAGFAGVDFSVGTPVEGGDTATNGTVAIYEALPLGTVIAIR